VPSKLEYENLFNEIFGTHIKWSKLSKEELVELATVLNHPEVFLKKLGVELPNEDVELVRRKMVKRLARFIKVFAEEWEGPIVSLIRKAMKEEKEEAEEKGERKPTKGMSVSLT